MTGLMTPRFWVLQNSSRSLVADRVRDNLLESNQEKYIVSRHVSGYSPLPADMFFIFRLALANARLPMPATQLKDMQILSPQPIWCRRSCVSPPRAEPLPQKLP